MVSVEDRALRDYLARREGVGDEMLLPAVFPRSALQATTGHPVLVDLDTLWIMTYMPSQAGVIADLVREVYGVDYADRRALEAMADEDGRVAVRSPSWLALWTARTEADWGELAGRYGFRYVLAPSGTELALPVRVSGPVWTLFEVPAGS
jgi:hypothetical protein